MYLRLRRDTAAADHHRDQAAGQQVVQAVAEIPIAVLREHAQQPCVQLFLRQAGLQVQLRHILFPRFHMGGGGEDQRPREAEVGKLHFPQLAPQLLFPLPRFPQGQGHVAQAESLHFPAVPVRGNQGDQGGGQGFDPVAQGAGHLVPVAGRAGLGIAEAPGAEDEAAAFHQGIAPADAGDGTIFRDDLPGPEAQEFRRALCRASQGVRHVPRLVGDGKNPIPPLRFQGDAQALEKGHDLLRRESADGAVEKAGVAVDVFQHVLRRAVVREVAAALAGDAQLPRRALLPLQHQGLRPRLRGGQGRHEPRRAAAYDADLSPDSSHRRRIRSRPLPAP